MDMVCGSLDQNAQANYKGAAKFLESKRLRDGRERACCLSSEYLTTDAEWNTRDRELWRTSAIHLFKGKTKQQRRQLGKGPGNSGEPDGGTLRAVLGHGIAPKSGAWEAHEKRREQVVRGAFREEGGAGQGRAEAAIAGVRVGEKAQVGEAGVTGRRRASCGKIRWRPSRRLEGARCSGRTIHHSHFGFVGFSWEPSRGETNLPHICPFLPSPVTRLPLCSGLSCRSRGGCCCTAKETAMGSCLVAPTMNKGGCTGEQVPVYLGEF